MQVILTGSFQTLQHSLLWLFYSSSVSFMYLQLVWLYPSPGSFTMVTNQKVLIGTTSYFSNLNASEKRCDIKWDHLFFCLHNETSYHLHKIQCVLNVFISHLSHTKAGPHRLGVREGVETILKRSWEKAGKTPKERSKRFSREQGHPLPKQTLWGLSVSIRTGNQ